MKKPAGKKPKVARKAAKAAVRKKPGAKKAVKKPLNKTSKRNAPKPESSDSPEIVREWLNPNFGYFYTVEETLVSKRTAFQELKVVRSAEFGKVLLLDGVTQVVEKNDWMYHEPMVHPALLAHPHPEEVLIIGGGDGGMAREALKHPSIRTVWQVDIDGDVYEFSAKHLPRVEGGAFSHPKVKKITQDGRAFVEAHPGAFDVVLMDMTDPFGPARMLYTEEFFRAVKRSFRRPEEGLFVMHAESPVSRPRSFLSILATLGRVFRNLSTLHLYVQMYAVQWCVAVATEGRPLRELPASEFDDRIARRRLGELEMISGEVIHALQVESPWLQRLRESEGKILRDADPDVADVIDPKNGRG